MKAYTRIVGVAAIAGGMTILGCSSVVDRAVDSAAQRGGETFGEAVGERVGQAAAAMVLARFPDNWTAEWTSLYVSYLFGMAFQSGSYAVIEDAYDPGEWTRWRMTAGEGEQDPVLERAYLATTDEGAEWWRVRYQNTETDEAIILEGLFSADGEELLRLRGQFPGEEEAKELPVQEGTYGYSAPTRLTAESLEGATVGTESVTVPAGTFQAQHIRYSTMGSTLDWWLNDDVPGGMVKYLRSAPSEENGQDDAEVPEQWTLELAEYGDGAESELGVI